MGDCNSELNQVLPRNESEWRFADLRPWSHTFRENTKKLDRRELSPCPELSHSEFEIVHEGVYKRKVAFALRVWPRSIPGKFDLS